VQCVGINQTASVTLQIASKMFAIL
jgi:hypothetical protein